MKITIIADDNEVLKGIKGLKIPFVKKHTFFKILLDAISAYEKKEKGQKIRAIKDNPKIEIIIEE